MRIPRIAPYARTLVSLVLCLGMGVAAPFAQPAEVCLSLDAAVAACCCPELDPPAAPEPKSSTACCDDPAEDTPQHAPPAASDTHVGCKTSPTAPAAANVGLERLRDESGSVVAACDFASSFRPGIHTGVSTSPTRSIAGAKIPTYLLCATLRR